MRTNRTRYDMPYIIPEADFDRKLNMSEKNVTHTEGFLAKGVQDFTLPGFTTPYGYRLVKSLRDDHYRLITDSESPETVYAVKLIFREDIVETRKSCTQILVWRTPNVIHDRAVHGLPQDFFRFFLEQFAIVVSDEQQTIDGRRFWERMISWAITTPGYHVYVSDGTEEERPLTFMTSWDDFYQTWADFCWGADKDVHTHRLLVISKDQLH
ncbi:hypothetical protein ACWKBE_002051 [Enterobacter hormaechei]|uniref:hypothetical protein n=1 Tax=Enterobacter cloacae complex TaxID=354276 RepID=UPI0024B991E8|nr:MULTISPECIES: hypothetical protein [Enterobacter cloacae complex]EHL7920559.1 hypothetical protein [Escherichia coli]EKV5346657.1 hypothetical protein [Enterobacter hormaechei]HCM9231721.1 hypothetical protein [Enterobacter bugandensis]HDR2525371.1 hypothetical protein [Enterobacter ludwigii]HEG2084500.1 hypothetical protein [Enterobacter kobei]